MPLPSDPDLGINSWLEDELYAQYLRDRTTVDDSWKHLFEEPNGHTPASEPSAPTPSPPPPTPPPEAKPPRAPPPAPAHIVPPPPPPPRPTPPHTTPVRCREETRRIINQHRTLLSRSKVSYTHLIGWALIKALEDLPALNHAYAEKDGQPF